MGSKSISSETIGSNDSEEMDEDDSEDLEEDSGPDSDQDVSESASDDTDEFMDIIPVRRQSQMSMQALPIPDVAPSPKPELSVSSSNHTLENVAVLDDDSEI